MGMEKETTYTLVCDACGGESRVLRKVAQEVFGGVYRTMLDLGWTWEFDKIGRAVLTGPECVVEQRARKALEKEGGTA